MILVGVLGIEPSRHAPKACVLPVYDTPLSSSHDEVANEATT